MWHQLLHALMYSAPNTDYAPAPMGYPNGPMLPGMQTGSPYSMPAPLAGLPAWVQHPPGRLSPAPASFNTGQGTGPAFGSWTHGGYTPVVQPDWIGEPGSVTGASPNFPSNGFSGDIDRRPPPPYRFHPAPMPSIHHHAPIDSFNAPQDLTQQRHVDIMRDFTPPQDAFQEAAQLQFALTRSRYDTRRRPVEKLLDHLETQATLHQHEQPARFDELPDEIRHPYSSELEYAQEVTASRMDHVPVEEALRKADMHAVPNTGITAKGHNNCFLISLVQHLTGRYESSNDDMVDQARQVLDGDRRARDDDSRRSPEHARILSEARDVKLEKNARIASGSAAAKLAVDLLNANLKDEEKMDVWVVSMVDGKPHIDKLESGSPSARVVSIWDKGGHFEAIVPNFSTSDSD